MTVCQIVPVVYMLTDGDFIRMIVQDLVCNMLFYI